MGSSVDLRGLESVMSHYEFRDTPFYRVYCGKDLKFYHSENDKEKGEVWLRDNLTIIGNGGSTAIHKIEFFDAVSGSGKLVQENLIGVVTFRLNAVNEMVGGIGGNGYGVQPFKTRQEELLEKILENQKAIDSRLNALENEEPEEEETAGSMGMKMISGVLDQPEMQRAFAQRLLGFLDSIMPLKPNAMQSNPATVGNVTITPDDVVVIESSIQTLLNNGMVVNDMKLLADLSQDPAQFNFLLSMLRKPKGQ